MAESTDGRSDADDTQNSARLQHCAYLDRNSAVLALTESEQKFRTVFERAPNPVTLIADGLIIDCNDATVRLHGFADKSQLIGLSPADLSTERQPDGRLSSEKAPAVIRMALENGECHFEWTIQRTDGTVLDSEVVLTAIMFGGKKIVHASWRNITTAKRAQEKLRKSEEFLRETCKHLEEIREEEKGSIAREIHDELGQLLTALKMEVFCVKPGRSEDLDLISKLDSINTLIDAMINRVRNIACVLRPKVLDLGLFVAVEWFLQDFMRRTGINCRVFVDQDINSGALNSPTTLTLFRIVQESLTNVARHAKATNVEVWLSLRGNSLELVIEDDGIGFEPSEKLRGDDGLGLRGIRERTVILGGNFTIERRLGAGMRLRIDVPILGP